MTETRPIRVLYVDDEALNRKLVQDAFALLLHRAGQVTTAASGEEALELLSADSAYDAIVADQRMPDMHGTALLAIVRERFPALARLVLTGYPSDAALRESVKDGTVQAVLSKPWKPKELEAAILNLVA